MRRILVGFAGLALAITTVAAYLYVTTNYDVAAGPGWRLLGSARLERPRSLADGDLANHGLATNADGFAAVWGALEVGASPSMDFDREVVVWLVGHGSHCWPPHVDGVVIKDETMAVLASRGFAFGSCISIAVPYVFVFGVDRGVIPAEPFQLRVLIDELDDEWVIDSLARRLPAGASQRPR